MAPAAAVCKYKPCRDPSYNPGMNAATLREYVTDAIRFWERGRILYNLILAVIVILYFAVYWPGSRGFLQIDSLLGLFLLAVLANIAYCAAYLVDLFAQMSGFREVWQRGRWVLFGIGMTFAAILTRWISIGLFTNGSVRQP